MSDNLVTFNIRYEKTLFQLKIKAPEDLLGFIEKLKNELDVEDTDELILLCPTLEGKMMEIKSDEDIDYLKKTKLCYNAVSKEVYCSVELVVVILHKKLPDDPRALIMNLSDKIDKLADQFGVLSQSIDDKLKNNESNIINNIRRTYFEDPQPNSGYITKTNVADDITNISKLETPKLVNRPQKQKKNKDKLPSSYNNNINEDSIQQNKSNISTTDIDTLLKKLVDEGFSNTIQNIIVLKRFDHNYEKSLDYLKST